ncbi:HD domain-containing protein (plasmid) [Paenibacillus thiaminolyticus]|uniref:HD-GYP domain-containing protein n=1 Tax=Paenibacillus thiaminolyticus TaxID=49283 RepID=UPI00232D1BC8|nr:HD domain-containing phosphohydrolase [Paenibacillus thiaminolyticus]WCF11456.1 HD domain-containing protein [Paenibacillus thiaminolyticus]
MFKLKSILESQSHCEVYTHSIGVAELARKFAEYLGCFSFYELQKIEEGAFLHDIGKVFVPQEILFKVDKLSAKEYGVMKRHTEYGYNFLVTGKPYETFSDEICEIKPLIQSMEWEEEVLKIVIQHHERMDGSGYPFGLTGKEIHPYARLIALCDVFDAITSKRSYKRELHWSYALDQIGDGLGTQFDQALGEQFISFITTKCIQIA